MKFFDGTILGFSGREFISDVINVGTGGIPRWGISHVGIVARGPQGNQLLFESTTLDPLPCEIQHKLFNGCQAHKLDDVIANYDGRIWAYPLTRPLYEFEESRLSEYLISTVGTPYDAMGAFRSAGVGFSWFESLLRLEDLHHIFCSAWVAKALSMIGVLPTDDADRWSPNHLLRRLRFHELVLHPIRLK